MANSSNHPKIKICGITNLADARFIAGAQADYLGFIFYENSPRYIEPAQAGAIINWIEGPQKVGVFVNQPLDDVNLMARQTGVDLVQLHGNESPEYCSLVEKPIIKVIHVTEKLTPKSLEREAKKFFPLVEYFLFDTKTNARWGGTGQTFDWDLLQELNTDIPLFLSGGINAENAGQAQQKVLPYGFDLCSSLERQPGKKDFDKVEAFMHKIRN